VCRFRPRAQWPVKMHKAYLPEATLRLRVAEALQPRANSLIWISESV
jgi:hypothetical protein